MENKLIVPATGEKIEDPEDLSIDIVTDEKELRRECRETSGEEVERRKIVSRMKEAMNFAWVNGFGLAAIQIGMPIRMAWYRRPEYTGNRLYQGKDIVLINPVIVEKNYKIVHPREGCLSIKDKLFNTERYNEVHVTADSFSEDTRTMLKIPKGNSVIVFKGLEAIIVQHEIDHMDGILCSDRAYKKMPGRNEKCPCGSGKKYKKCCLK